MERAIQLEEKSSLIVSAKAKIILVKNKRAET